MSSRKRGMRFTKRNKLVEKLRILQEDPLRYQDIKVTSLHVLDESDIAFMIDHQTFLDTGEWPKSYGRW